MKIQNAQVATTTTTTRDTALSYLVPTRNTAYLKSNFMESVSEPTYPFRKWSDPLDHRFVSLLATTVAYTEVQYKGQPLTTISFKEYNTDSLWWIVLLYNGFTHPSDIPDGYMLRLPDISIINEASSANTANASRTATAGSVVII